MLNAIPMKKAVTSETFGMCVLDLIYIYIYIYKREREREREIICNSGSSQAIWFHIPVCVLYSLSRKRRRYRTQTGDLNPYPLWSPNKNYILLRYYCTNIKENIILWIWYFSLLKTYFDHKYWRTKRKFWPTNNNQRWRILCWEHTLSESVTASHWLFTTVCCHFSRRKLLVISLVEYKAKMGTEMKDSVKCIFL